MYLVSAYFDDTTCKRIQSFIDAVAHESGNAFMLDNHVPPHMTITAFEARPEAEAKLKIMVEQVCSGMKRGALQWMAVGTFFPYVIYIEPVLNHYLQALSIQFYEAADKLGEVRINKYYRPYNWIPHTTVGKKLRAEEMQAAFAVMQKHFCPIEGEIVRIGLAKPNPHRDLAGFVL